MVSTCCTRGVLDTRRFYTGVIDAAFASPCGAVLLAEVSVTSSRSTSFCQYEVVFTEWKAMFFKPFVASVDACCRWLETPWVVEDLGDLYAESGQTLQGSFSAAAEPNFARKCSLETSRRDLHNALLCTFLEPQFVKRGGKKRAPLAQNNT